MAKRKTPKVQNLRPETITKDELGKLQNVVRTINDAQKQIGVIEMQKHSILRDISQLQDMVAEIQKEFKEPGPNFVHPGVYCRGRILNDFESLAIKYGTEVFETYIKNLYNNYPSPEDQSTVDYIKTSNRNSIFLISHKWRLISELFSSIHNYFEDKGVTL